MTGDRVPPRKLLAIFAHPDDETFLAGPILAKYAHEGVHVELVVAAPGERRLALECAAKILGIARVHVLNFSGSSMRQSDDDRRTRRNHLVLADLLLATANLQRIASEIARVIEASRPDVVLVDSPYGAYGHPDHIVIHRAAAAAFRQAAAPTARLYALAFPMWLVRLNLGLLGLSGIPVSRLGPDRAIDLRQVVVESRARTGLVNVAR